MFKSFDDVLNQDSLNGYDVTDIAAKNINNKETEELERLYIKNESIGGPAWATLFDVSISRLSASGLYLRKVNGRIFAIAFGSSGRFLIKDLAIVRRFGLMTVLNAVDPNSLRSIDKVVLSDNGIQSRTQSSQPSEGTAFGIDIQQDLVKNVSGKALAKDLYGTTITGKDSLNVTIKVTLETLDKHLVEYLRASEDIRYKENFSFIDNVKPCDAAQTYDLDKHLVKKINDGKLERKWLTVPDIIDWSDHAGFIYSHTRLKQEPGDDISFESFTKSLNDNEAISVDLLHKHQVIRMDDDGKKAKDKWSIYRCLYAEMTLTEKGGIKTQYILNEGDWYAVKKDFREVVEAGYSAIAKTSMDLSLIPYEDSEVEESYNARLANALGAYNFDKKKVTIVGRSPFEVCDVLTRDNKLIHVKRYSGSSALSHLFNQGYVSANLLLEPEIRKRVNQKNVDGFRFNNPASDLDTSKYEVVYGIISRVDNDLDIPFFSKIMLVRTVSDLRKLGYKASLIKIQHNKSKTPEVA